MISVIFTFYRFFVCTVVKSSIKISENIRKESGVDLSKGVGWNAHPMEKVLLCGELDPSNPTP